MRELQTGLWHWEARHPDWEPSKPWHQVYGQLLSPGEVSPQVSSYAIDEGDRLLLFDPRALPSEIEERAAGREAAIVLTSPWHERDSRSLVERLSAPVFVPPPDKGSSDVAWLRAGDTVEGHLFLGRPSVAGRSRGVPRKGAERRHLGQRSGMSPEEVLRTFS